MRTAGGWVKESLMVFTGGFVVCRQGSTIHKFKCYNIAFSFKSNHLP